LKIKEFRNLKDFEIRFAQTGQAPEGSFEETLEYKSHAVIGQNATGKSNFLEALIIIFRDLDLNNAAAFEYEMDYNDRCWSDGKALDEVRPDATLKELTVRQKMKRKAVLSDLKKRIHAHLDERKKRRIECAAPPRYDSVFFSGIEWLNSRSEEPLDSGEYTAIISDEMRQIGDTLGSYAANPQKPGFHRAYKPLPELKSTLASG